jgi:hypothetical protein
MARRRKRVKQKSKIVASFFLSLSHCNVCPCRALTLSSFLPFLSLSPTLFSDLANLQISRIFLYPTAEGNVWISTQHSAQTQRENLSTVADPDKANSVG